ncbi:Hypothetical protein A7982_08430 [Minicystis rosea]|nr:Hypothetical protein A7982_08430 [Minicystis rosea]
MPSRHTSVDAGNTLPASADRSSSVDTSRWTPRSSVHLHTSRAVKVASSSRSRHLWGLSSGRSRSYSDESFSHLFFVPARNSGPRCADVPV